MTSSPGPIPRASTHVCKAWVPEPVATQNRLPISLAYSFSKVGTVPFVDWIRHQIPLRVVLTTASTISSSTCGHSGQALFRRTGSPPRMASLEAFRTTSAWAGSAVEATAAIVPADAVAMNCRLVKSGVCMDGNSVDQLALGGWAKTKPTGRFKQAESWKG